jgi:hypothetical protein
MRDRFVSNSVFFTNCMFPLRSFDFIFSASTLLEGMHGLSLTNFDSFLRY